MSSEYIYDTKKSRLNMMQEFKELFNYRLLLRLMVQNNLLTRYKRSVLGALWTVLNPLLMMVVISFAFSLIFDRLPSYPVYVLSGMILWNFFTQTTTGTINSLIWGGGLIKRIYFPRSSYVLSNTGSGIINLIVSLLPLAIIMVIYKHSITLAVLFVPIAILITSIFILGISFFLSAFAVFFSDVVDLYQAILRALFYLTPIMYPEDILPEKFSFLIKINPLYSFINIFRIPLYEGQLPSFSIVSTATLWALFTFIIGSRYFISKSNEIAYRI